MKNFLSRSNMALYIYVHMFIILFCAKPVVSQVNPQKNPNILLIFMDDLGYGDLNSYGGTGYQMPNIQKLASQGMKFTNFYAAQPICSASRAGILTGCYPNRIGLTGALSPDSEIGLADEEQTIPEVLKTQGYATGMVGKWHLGHQKKFLPLQHGFDEYFGIPYSNDMWPVAYNGTAVLNTTSRRYKFPKLPLINGNETIEYIIDLEDQNQLTTRFTEFATDFIEKNQSKPFFLYFAHPMPHVPLAVSDKFRGKSEQGLYGDVMMEIDWSVGQLIKILEEYNLRDNTLIILTSDNGPWLNFGNHAGSAGGLREGKQTTWEGGLREPALFSWPKVIPSGSVNDKLASTIDLLPTISAITNADLPNQKIDGVNILPLLKNKSAKSPRSHFYYYYNKNSLQAVRMGSWKLVLPHNFQTYEDELPGMNGLPGKRHTVQTALSLYDLRRDPGERYNVIEQYPEVVENIMVLVRDIRNDLGDDLVSQPGINKRQPGKAN